MKYSSLIQSLLDLTIAEDCSMGDLTADALIPDNATAALEIVAKEPMILCGQRVLLPLAERFGLTVADTQWFFDDGASLQAGQTVARYEGLTRSLLGFERPALNFLQRLSGISTVTREYVNRISHAKAVLLDTRKTTPGHRLLEKYATRVGGAVNHRFGLDSGWLIKENHIRQVGGVTAALHRAREFGTHGLKIEIEVETLEELAEAVAGKADIVLLDNFSIADVSLAVHRYGHLVCLEASGGIQLENIAAYADTGVHCIAVGAITHAARAYDLSANLITR